MTRVLISLAGIALLLTSCSLKDPAERTRAAIDDLVVASGSSPGSAYRDAAAHIDEAESAAELGVIVEHLNDNRPTQQLEALATLDGSPVSYTIGDALFWMLCLKFVTAPQSRLDTRNQIKANPNLATRELLAAWFRRHECDLKRLREQRQQLSQSGA